MVEKLKDHRVVRVASYNEHTAALVEPFDESGNFARSYGDNSIPVTTSFLQSMKDMIDEEEYSDVTFIVENKPVHAHRIILAKRCEHFSAMFRSGMRESLEREIHIPDVTHTVFLLLMEYIYTDSVIIDLEHAVELFIFADLYQLDRLKEMCTVVVRRNLNGDNAAILLQNTNDSHCHVLKNICMEYIVANFDVISKSEGIKHVSHALLLEILAIRP